MIDYASTGRAALLFLINNWDQDNCALTNLRDELVLIVGEWLLELCPTY